MADFRFPLNPSGAGTAFGWTGPSKSELQRQNEARIQANLLLERGGTMEDVLAIPNLGIGDVENLKKGLQASQERWGQTIKAMQPSSELTGQTQLGPVQQAPAFDFMRQFDQPPIPPTPLASAVFQPSTPPGPMAPPTPGRATWGDEALFPQGGARTMGPEALRPDELATPASGWSPEHGRYMPNEFGPTGYPPVSDLYAPGIGTLGGATAYAPPPPHPDVIPEYLRHPETTAALPPPPDTFVPGGQRMPIPGRTLTQLMLDRPELGEFAMANLPKLRAAEAEYSGNQAVEGYVQDFRTIGEEKALEKWGPVLDQSELGRKIADNARERLTQRVTARATATSERQTQANIDKQRLEQEQALETKRMLLQRAAEADKQAGGRSPEGDQLRLIAQDPKAAEEYRQYLDQQQKKVEAKVKAFDGVPYTISTDPQTGEPRMSVTPGFTPKVEPWWKGKSLTELVLMKNAPNTPPDIKAQAEQGIKELNEYRIAEARATVPGTKPTQDSINAAIKRRTRIDMLEQISEFVTKNPNWVGRDTGVLYAEAVRNGIQNIPGLGPVPKGYSDFLSLNDNISADLLHELAQGNLTGREEATYGSFRPYIGKGKNPFNYLSQAQYNSNLKASLAMLKSLAYYHTALERGIPEEDAAAELKRRLKADTAEAAEVKRLEEEAASRRPGARPPTTQPGGAPPGKPSLLDRH